METGKRRPARTVTVYKRYEAKLRSTSAIRSIIRTHETMQPQQDDTL